MSESIVRKVQPFTIGTRLSVPAVTKCQEFTPDYLQSSSLDNCTLQHNLNSLYLSRSPVHAHGPRVSPVVQPQSPVRQEQEDMAAEDQLNQNITSAAAVARSIKKITISGNKDRAENRTNRAECVFVPGTTQNNNNNNNITSSEQSLPRIVGVSCENKAKSQFKVLLRKESCDEHQTTAQTKSHMSEEQQISSLESGFQRTDIHPLAESEESPGVTSQNDCFTQRNSLFNKEALQAEAWIKGKLQDLKDGRNIDCCPLQDGEEACQTLQRDLKDFENTLIQLNQMGEQLICKMNPTSDLVKKQLSQLRDQWQTLKTTAANQTRALGGAKNLQEFNTKVEKLEAWIKEKEEPTSLVNVLGENVDKMQLTRRILDLKQDEQLYRNLYEEINHLALKLEKQGKADGKNIGNQRKHINKMWLKVQAHLKNYHENLQLALEVSSFYQQADNILLAIHNMRKGVTASKELDKLGDQEIRDIAGQIMMLDVSVSQLSNLHPALATGVIQKQTEIKESWALLQKTLRTDRAAPPSASPTVCRDEGDPSTREQCTVGTELQRTMGKEVKEEQNRLKGFVGAADAGNGQAPEQDSASLSSPMGEADVCANDVIARHQLKGESKKPKAEPKNDTAQPGHPPLHVQLQKFTVSADKTLSWLKDNVSLATQICSVASFEGLEAARRCQRTLEQEILNNRTRIEVVKKEGRGLVRAQHPGSSRIQEFLGQLEVLWDELRRRHQRNALFLQASEELGFRVVKVLQALGSLDAWLESVELSMKESSLAADPETMSVAERQSCLLEREVTARGHELSTLRQEVERLHCQSHPLTRGLPARMDTVERKYQRVQSALTQQSSELQDTRMLTEFLEQVELEESQERSQFSLGQPLQSELSPAPTLMELRSSGTIDPLLEPMGDPVEELREAVEMLNDTVRERGRSQNHDQAIRELLSKHATLAVRVEESLCRSKDLGLDILEKETDMAVQCELERCGLDALWEEQDHLEIDHGLIKEEVKALESQAKRLEELCPERVHVFGVKIQSTLQAWSELGASVKENKSRLREFVLLQDFFRSYLQMISWTEDTRSCIFSDTALQHGKDGQAPMAAKLDLQIEQKFEEFEELAATGRNILDKEHHLSQMVRERMEELRSMLGWISVHWRAQKQQWLQRHEAQDNVYSIMCSSLAKPEAHEQQTEQSVYSPVLSGDEERQQKAGENLSVLCKPTNKQTEDGYEVMKGVPLHSPDGMKSPKSSVFVLKDKSSPGLGNTVNLILSFGNTGDSQVQVLDDDEEETSEPVRRLAVPQPPARKTFWKRCQGLLENTLGSLKRKKKIYRQSANEVSTYLHVKDNSLAPGPVYECITFPRLKSHSASSSPPSSPSTPANISQTTNFHLPTGGSTSIFSSLKRIGKKRKRKRDTRRHTIQKIIGVEEQEDEMPHSASEIVNYDTRTWPLKDGKRKKAKSPGNVAKNYMKNPLIKDIESECTGDYNITPYAVSEGPSANHVKGHCRFLSLGSVLSFDLPKDMTLIPSIQDIITIAPPESKKATGADPDSHSQRQTALSSFKQTRPVIVANTSDENALNCEKDTTNDCAFKQQSLVLKSNPTGQSSNQLQVECTILNGETDQQSSKIKNPIYVNHHPTRTCQKHECLSVHTLVKDLNGHKYHKCTKPHNGRSQSQASQMIVNLKSTVNVSIRQDSVDSGISSLGSVKLSSDITGLENPPAKGTVGKMMSLDVGCITNNTESSKTNASSTNELESEAVHVDHQQFEEVEEELEGIWSQNFRNSMCSDIMYQQNQDETLSTDQNIQPSSPSASKSPAVLYRNLVTASAPNLLVAEFKLPPSVQSLLGYDKHPNRQLSSLVVGERRSWAAFPNREPQSSSSSGTCVSVNETASDPVKLPEIEDSQRYIYQYREEEEEEEEEREEEEHTSCSEDHSLSLFSVNCQKTSPTSEHMDMQDQTTTTGGRCITLRPELQSMEGTLERKQRLQLGGKKAASRGWGSYHTVLYRNILCFYQDRKDILRSPICGLPLNLIGAECVPAPEYTKKPNCFHLRLRDGSEYLLNASSRILMKKWIMKIQANTGRLEAGPLTPEVCRDADLLKPVTSSSCSGCPSPHEVTSTTFPRLKPRGTAQTTLVLREFSHMSRSGLRSVEDKLNPSSAAGGWAVDEDDDSLKQTVTQTPGGGLSDTSLTLCAQDGLNSQRRSHSFTSATYQKISPVLMSPGGRALEKGSNYCVTLLVGDKSRDVPTVSRSDAPVTGEPCALRYYTSLPRPRNKSVFKKFFGRKDF